MKKINLLKNTTIVALSMMLVFAPASAFAKNDKNGDDRNKGNSCFRVYSSLFFPNLVSVNTGINGKCWFPFGLAKKFKTDTTTRPADTTAPVISKIETEARWNDASIKWETNEKTTTTVFYGLNAGIDTNNTSTLKVENNRLNKDHKIKLSGLSTNTKYYVVIRSKDASGNITSSSELTFTTKTQDNTNDTTPPTISSVVALSLLNSVSVGFVTNEPTTAKVYYSTTTPVNTSSSNTMSVESNQLKTRHLIVVPNLSTNTNYHMIIQSKDNAGNIQSTNEFTAKAGI